jgi:mannose-6-phosphate isomerase-like protein (cupin superfamily)
MIVERPWGTYFNIHESPKYLVKEITINPGARISRQFHNHRSEHWVCISGIACVEIMDHQRWLRPGDSVFIPQTVTHRLSNPGRIPLVITEIQCGEHLSEDDIVRLDDDYNRMDKKVY